MLVRPIHLAIFATSLLALPAVAGVPDPRFSTTDRVVVGSPLGVAIGGVPAGFDVVVRDINNVPLAGSTVELRMGASGLKLYANQAAGTTIDCPNGAIRRLTDAAGAVNFVPRLGGWNDAFTVEVRADGVILAFVPGRSPDYNRDGRVGLADFAMFSDDFLFQPATLRSDFDLSGVVGLADFAIFTDQFLGLLDVSQPLCP